MDIIRNSLDGEELSRVVENASGYSPSIQGRKFLRLPGSSANMDPRNPLEENLAAAEECIDCKDFDIPMLCECQEHRQSVVDALRRLMGSIDIRLQADKEKLKRERKRFFARQTVVADLERNIGRLEEIREEMDAAEVALVERRERIAWISGFLGHHRWNSYLEENGIDLTALHHLMTEHHWYLSCSILKSNKGA